MTDQVHHLKAADLVLGAPKFTLHHDLLHHLLGPPALDGGEAEAPPKPKRAKRRPDAVREVKRAMAAGLNVRAVNVTADGVEMTFGEAEAPADATVIETADELRKLI